MTSIETGPTWSERFNPRNWSLAWKLVIVGLVPALLALALGVLRISDQAEAAAQLGQGSTLIGVQSQVGSAADALRQERDAAVVFVAGRRTGDRNALSTGFGQTDSATTESLAAARRAGTLEPASTSALEQATTALGGLATLRRDVTDNPAVASTQIGNGYTEIITRFDRLDTALLGQVSTPGTASLVSALDSIRDAKEQLALQHTVLGAGIRATQLQQPGDPQIVAATSSRLASDSADYQAALSSEQLARFGPLLDPVADTARQAIATTIVNTAPDRPIISSPADLDTAYTAELTTAKRSADLIRQDVTAAARAAEAAASNLAGINSVILMLGLLIGITVAYLVARGLIRSLRVLRTAALDVAERRLPQAVESMRAGESPDVTVDPVPINSRDEVGQVARAFDAVHGQAVRLAADQAALQSNVSAMFVNLSRRSQVLVERQLQLIEQLESNEQDADQLSNLFQLDHLATRMRRNSENLLVLAGTDLAKRNIAPVPMVDVLRAAVSEVEQYQRVVVQAPPTAAIVGRAGSDLVHLLAELLDNATNFSPPDSQVVMSTTRTSDGSIIVEIADRGVGMIDHELSDANQRLGGPSSVDVSASRRMGLFVVGRLGARHGIGVRLSTSSSGGPGAGLTASVTVPAYLIPGSEPVESARPIGIPQPAGLPAQGGRGAEVPPQRANGTGRPGSLSALVAGTDGPANPVGVFEGTDGTLFGTVATNGAGSNSGSPDSSGNPLPSRRPGSSLRPEGPPPPELPASGPPDDADADDQHADDQRRAREIAEQARRDQEAAAEREREVTAAEQPAAKETPDTQNGAAGGSSGAGSNGADPQVFLAPAPFAGRPVADEKDDEPDSDDQQDSAPTSDDERSGSLDQRAEERAPADGQRTDQQQRGNRSESTAPPASRPPLVSPPTTPMPTVRPGNTAAAPQPGPTSRPAAAEPPHPGPPPSPPAPHAPQPIAQAPADLPAGRPDELFAPSVPNIAEPEPERTMAEAQAGFERGETTPIFAEIASAWFRSNRPVPVNWEAEDGADKPEAQVQARPVPTPAPPVPPHAPRPDVRAPLAAEPRMPPRPPAPAPRPVARPTPAPVEAARVEPTPEAEPAAVSVSNRAFAGAAFAGVADEGWRAVSGIESDRPDELTAAGLPKRRPRARLVPGSAGSAVLSPPATASRSAETIRGRLASYQQGVRQGRETRARGEAVSGTDIDTDTSMNDEEQS